MSSFSFANAEQLFRKFTAIFHVKKCSEPDVQSCSVE